MTVLTVSLDEETVERIKFLADRLYSGRRGSISQVIRDAVRKMYRDYMESSEESVYRVYRDGKLIFEASTLDILRDKLRELDIDPRNVHIIHSSFRGRARMGYRYRV